MSSSKNEIKQIKPIEDLKSSKLIDTDKSYIKDYGKTACEKLNEKYKDLKQKRDKLEMELIKKHKDLTMSIEKIEDYLLRIKIASDIITRNQLLEDKEYDELNNIINNDINGLILAFCPELTKKFGLFYYVNIDKYSVSIDDAIHDLITTPNLID